MAAVLSSTRSPRGHLKQTRTEQRRGESRVDHVPDMRCWLTLFIYITTQKSPQTARVVCADQRTTRRERGGERRRERDELGRTWRLNEDGLAQTPGD